MAGDLVEKIIAKSFPEGSQLVVNVKDVAPAERFWVIPGKAGPRWLIPQNYCYGVTMFKQWKPYDLASRIKWKLLHGAYRSGHLEHVPGVVGIGISGFSKQCWAHLGWAENAPPIPIIYIGTPGATQKAVIALVDSSRRLVSFAKTPLGRQAPKNILHENDILHNLSNESPGLAPRSFFVNRERGLAVQEAVVGKPLGHHFTSEHIGYLNRLRVLGEVTTIRDESENLARRLDSINNKEQGLRCCIEKLMEAPGNDIELPVAQAHGDFKPWHVMRSEAGDVIAIDWEFSEPRQILGIDAIHYYEDFSLGKRKKVNHNLGKALQQLLPELDFGGARLPLLRSFLHYHSLWYAVVLCENGYTANNNDLYDKQEKQYS